MTPENEYWSRVVLIALCIWREARGETYECKLAVAHSIRNRVEKPKWWGNSYETVIWKDWQYSSFTDPKDPQTRKGWQVGPVWEECMNVAKVVLDGKVPPKFPGADSYYDISIPAPNWAKPEQFCGQLGKIRFYNTDGDHPSNTK